MTVIIQNVQNMQMCTESRYNARHGVGREGTAVANGTEFPLEVMKML